MANPFILCPTARLARAIAANLSAAQLGRAHLTPQVRTLVSWLDETLDNSMLCGEITEAPTRLDSAVEAQLWQQVIAQSLQKNMASELFDLAGLADAAIEANAYVVAYKLPLPRDAALEETRQFTTWQQAFYTRCKALNALEPARYLDWQLAQLAAGKGDLPKEIIFTAFDQTAPQEAYLRQILSARGVILREQALTAPTPAIAEHAMLPNQEAECRAAVAWVRNTLAEKPNSQLAIIAPHLNTVRETLADLLADTQPVNTLPDYNFSLGTPLSSQPMITTALHLLRLINSYTLHFADISRLLLAPFWSASLSEADARAQIEARLREALPAQISLQSLVNFVEKQGITPYLLKNMQAAIALKPASKRQAASDWATHFAAQLQALAWPGERGLNSVEYQARNAWDKALAQLSHLDILQAPMPLSAALSALQQIAKAQIFQPESTHTARVQILGVMEALSQPVDAAWVMGMNDHIWPPPARPNALLPAQLQRNAKLPNADTQVQMAFATQLHKRILHSAQTLVFSSSLADGDTGLRASPLMQDTPASTQTWPLAATLAEALSQQKGELEWRDDFMAPAPDLSQRVRGGTSLFAAQAKCPAWAFYQYRLGASALKTPANGLDFLTRGSLTHAMLSHFWQPPNAPTRHAADLQALSPQAQHLALNEAAQAAIASLKNAHWFSPNLLALEQERLVKLGKAWLQFERQFIEENSAPFNMLACETEREVNIGGIGLKVKIDRMQQEADGSCTLIDYKTGSTPALKSWGEARITEPQLPIYACFYPTENPVQAVQFALVKIGEHGFNGIAEADFLVEKSRKNLVKNFNNWHALKTHWQSSLTAIADEIKTGYAAVIFIENNHLDYCEVLPLLRLPERQLQFERKRGLV